MYSTSWTWGLHTDICEKALVHIFISYCDSEQVENWDSLGFVDFGRVANRGHGTSKGDTSLPYKIKRSLNLVN